MRKIRLSVVAPGVIQSYNGRVTLAGGSVELFDLREALTHAFQTKTSSVESKPASLERSSQGLFAFLDRTTYVKSGPVWAASQKHASSGAVPSTEDRGAQGATRNGHPTEPATKRKSVVGAVGAYRSRSSRADEIASFQWGNLLDQGIGKAAESGVPRYPCIRQPIV